MNSTVSLAKVEQEIADAKEYGESYGWEFSLIDRENLRFTVLLQSPVDREKYVLEFGFDNYPEYPYLIDFIDPITGEKGAAKCMPKGALTSGDNFFHSHKIVICHPCSRKAYKGYTNLHTEWSLIGWQKNAGDMTNLKSILAGIYNRISTKTTYDGRMA